MEETSQFNVTLPTEIINRIKEFQLEMRMEQAKKITNNEVIFSAVHLYLFSTMTRKEALYKAKLEKAGMMLPAILDGEEVTVKVSSHTVAKLLKEILGLFEDEKKPCLTSTP